MNNIKRFILLTVLILCSFVFVLVAVLKGGDNKVPNMTENHEANERETIISGLEQKLAELRLSDDSLPNMSKEEISSAVDLLHKKGMDYNNITAQDLRHANDVIPEVKTFSNEEFERMSDLERAKVGWLSTIGDEPKNQLVFWILPEKIENGYNISIDPGNELIEPRYLYDWSYAKLNYSADFDYLSRDEEGLLNCIGKAYSEWGNSDFNTYTSYRGLDADEYLAPGEEGRFVLLRWFRFKDSDKRGWAVCYVDVVNSSEEKRIKRDCKITQILFEV